MYSENSRCNKNDIRPSSTCNGRVLENSTFCNCENTPCDGGNEVVTVVLSEFTVKINVESKIKLCDRAIEIKRIKKNVFITQCRLIAGTNILFLKGFVRKNIEYATANCRSKNGVCGDIRHTTVNVPFECTTEVEFKNHPEFEIKDDSTEIFFADDKCLGSDIHEMDLLTKETLNQKVHCKFLGSKIFEADILEECENKKNDCCHPSERVFDSFIEKEVIYIKLKLLQEQQRY